MADGTDVTSLTPVITLAPGATISPKTVSAQDFSQQVTYTVTAQDGTTSIYWFLAYEQNIKSRGLISISILPSPNGTTNPAPGVHIWDSTIPFGCVSIPDPYYMIDTWYFGSIPVSHSPYLNETIPVSCSLQATFKLIPPPISGPNLLCVGSSQTFTVSNPPPGFTWNQSNNLSRIGSGNSVTISGISKGAGWVSINYGGTELTRYNVWVGVIDVPSVTGPFNAPLLSYTQYQVAEPQGSNPTGYQWTVNPNVSTRIIGGNSNTVSISFDNTGYYTVHCKLSNACGWGTDHYAPVYVYSSKSYTVAHPNPASDVLILSFDPDKVAAAKSSSQRSFSLSIKLLDNFGRVCQQTTSNGDIIQLNVSGLSNGMYFLHVHDGITPAPEVHKIIINH